MNTKMIFCLAICVFLMSCVTTEPTKHSSREIECAVLSNRLGMGEPWRASCVQDENVYVQAYKKDFSQMRPETLCHNLISKYYKKSGQIAKEVASSRKVDCESYRKKFAQEYAAGLSMDRLCSVWNVGTNDRVKDKAVRAEVKSRDVNCPALLAASAQRQTAAAQKMQANAMQHQAEAQKRQAEAALIEALKPEPLKLEPPTPIKAPTQTTCRTIGDMLYCDTY